MAEPHLPLRDRSSEFTLELPLRRDPLSEFASELSGPGASNRLFEHALPIGVTAAPDVSLAKRQPSGGRWFAGAVMLGVGLVAGFAGGAAVVTQYDGGQSVRFPVLSRLGPELPRVEVQPPPDRPVAAQPADDPIAIATHDPPGAIEVDALTPAPEPLVTGQRTPAVPVRTMAESHLAVLYVQSRPTGAEVYLDGQLVSTTPFQLSDITPGRHTIRVVLEGYRNWLTPVDLEPGARMEIAAALEQ